MILLSVEKETKSEKSIDDSDKNNEEELSDIKHKFSLENNPVELNKLSKKCKKHPENDITFACSICNFEGCEKDFHKLEEKKLGIKVICKKCYLNFVLKAISIIFMLITFSIQTYKFVKGI